MCQLDTYKTYLQDSMLSNMQEKEGDPCSWGAYTIAEKWIYAYEMVANSRNQPNN